MQVGILKPSVKNEKGFTFIELMMVFVILGILAQISFTFAIDLRQRTYDSVALADGKNLLTVATNAFVGLEDISFDCVGCSGAIGDRTSGGDARNPIFTLSEGVKVIMTGQSGTAGTGFIEAFVYHDRGSNDPDSPGGSGKREFYFLFDEALNLLTSPSFST